MGTVATKWTDAELRRYIAAYADDPPPAVEDMRDALVFVASGVDEYRSLADLHAQLVDAFGVTADDIAAAREYLAELHRVVDFLVGALSLLPPSIDPIPAAHLRTAFSTLLGIDGVAHGIVHEDLYGVEEADGVPA